MNVGIITFHRVTNLGAVLQASALQNYINDHICDCEIIDYYPNNSISVFMKLRMMIYTIKRMITCRSSVPSIKKENRFNRYRRVYCRCSRNTFYGDKDIFRHPPTYDILISGSDQILNLTLSGSSMAYYLGFDNKTKKISYASSFGREKITEEETQAIMSELSKFSALSVRENSGSEIIQNILHRPAQLVLDPVFLLNKQEWFRRCDEDMKLPSKYIFVYSMEISETLEQAVVYLQRRCNLPVIVVRGGGQPGRIVGSEDESCGPSQFLRYVRDAKYVVTNSFHGCALSILMEKSFFCIPHSERNTRIENLLSLVGESDKMLSSDAADIMSYKIDGVLAKDKLSDMIDKSKHYLHSKIIN